MNFEPAFIEAMQDAVTPTEADVLTARGVILDALTTASEPTRRTDFEDTWLTAHDSRRPQGGHRFTAQASAEHDRRLADPDPSDPHLMVIRARHAVSRALAQLTAEEVLVRSEGNQYPLGQESIPVDYPGGGSSATVYVHSPAMGEQGNTARFMLVRPPAPRGEADSEVLLPVEELVAGLDDILGLRGLTMVRESRRALQRGLYLASSSLLAAASEAAWFNLGRVIPKPPNKLAQVLDSGRDIAAVIQMCEQKMRDLKPSPGSATINEVVTQAHLFRVVRNYALHPVENHDQDRETWLTETGATLLTIAARRYFIKLAGLQDRLQTPTRASI